MEAVQQRPWFYSFEADFTADPANRLVIVPPSAAVPKDEALQMIAGFSSVAIWLHAERKFLVHTGERLGFTRAMQVFRNASRMWTQVHPVGGSGDAAGWAAAGPLWPPCPATIKAWGFLSAGAVKRKAASVTAEELAEAEDGPHGTRVIKRVRASGRKYSVFLCARSQRRFRSRREVEDFQQRAAGAAQPMVEQAAGDNLPMVQPAADGAVQPMVPQQAAGAAVPM